MLQLRLAMARRLGLARLDVDLSTKDDGGATGQKIPEATEA
jgi:hypothetical protein